MTATMEKPHTRNVAEYTGRPQLKMTAMVAATAHPMFERPASV